MDALSYAHYTEKGLEIFRVQGLRTNAAFIVAEAGQNVKKAKGDQNSNPQVSYPGGWALEKTLELSMSKMIVK